MGRPNELNKRKDLVLKVARYMLNTSSTLTQTATMFNISSTTIRTYIESDLPIINERLYNKIKRIQEINSKDALVKARSIRDINKDRNIFLLNEFIYNKLLNSSDGWVLITNAEMTNVIKSTRIYVIKLMKFILEDDMCLYERRTIPMTSGGYSYEYRIKKDKL